MTWILVIGLTLVAFAIGVFAFGVSRNNWATFAAALALGLAGYALQATTGLPGSPASGSRADAGAWALVDERKAMIGDAARSHNDKVLIADALARQGQYANAAAMLRAAVTDDPRDAEAWLALGNVLVEHADGSLTEPALLAYRRATEFDSTGVGPGYFLGLALIRQGRIAQARTIWAETLQDAAADATGRELLLERLARLDALLRGEAPIAIPQ